MLFSYFLAYTYGRVFTFKTVFNNIQIYYYILFIKISHTVHQLHSVPDFPNGLTTYWTEYNLGKDKTTVHCGPTVLPWLY
jgi:hypothetical protein